MTDLRGRHKDIQRTVFQQVPFPISHVLDDIGDVVWTICAPQARVPDDGGDEA